MKIIRKIKSITYFSKICNQNKRTIFDRSTLNYLTRAASKDLPAKKEKVANLNHELKHSTSDMRHELLAKRENNYRVPKVYGIMSDKPDIFFTQDSEPLSFLQKIELKNKISLGDFKLYTLAKSSSVDNQLLESGEELHCNLIVELSAPLISKGVDSLCIGFFTSVKTEKADPNVFELGTTQGAHSKKSQNFRRFTQLVRFPSDLLVPMNMENNHDTHPLVKALEKPELKTTLIDAISFKNPSLIDKPVRERTVFDRKFLLELGIHFTQKSLDEQRKEFAALIHDTKHMSQKKKNEELKKREMTFSHSIQSPKDAQFIRSIHPQMKEIIQIKADLEKDEEKNKIQEESKRKKETQMKQKADSEERKRKEHINKNLHNIDDHT